MLDVIKKHAKDFTPAAGKGKKVLQGIHYRSDGSVMITDSHTLLYAKDVHDLSESIVKHHKTDKVINENYPNLNSVLNMNYSTEFKINAEEVYPSLKTVKVSEIIDEVATLKDDLTFNVYDISGQSYVLSLFGTKASFYPFHMKVANFHKCFSLFKDLGVVSVDVRIAGNMNPIRFSDEHDRLHVLIAPVRRY
ncbi:hypothetical protein J2S74_002289 [Evansella vedderi]|uniref:Uncharacterized protein n=1 Tax=Evansella vedderi TaxID=38282 RepID=A0ABT9ZVY6_9BACI|nr:hypothetical protein [Evansella vedderi]MDQ0254907.1 hypothetical protein [Evansella vedderi]